MQRLLGDDRRLRGAAAPVAGSRHRTGHLLADSLRRSGSGFPSLRLGWCGSGLAGQERDRPASVLPPHVTARQQRCVLLLQCKAPLLPRTSCSSCCHVAELDSAADVAIIIAAIIATIIIVIVKSP